MNHTSTPRPFRFMLVAALLTQSLPNGLVANEVIIEQPSETDGKVISREVFGINLSIGTTPSVWASSEYRKGLRYLNPSVVRLHNNGMLKTSNWIKDGQWNQESIHTILSGVRTTLPGVKIQLNIPNFPDLFEQSNGVLDREAHQAYAEFVAKLIDLTNNRMKLRVDQIEVINENDHRYAGALKSDAMQQYAEMHNAAATAIKGVDPSVEFIAGAFATPRVKGIRRFTEILNDDIDGISYHHYGTGGKTSPHRWQDLFKRPRSLAATSLEVRQNLDQVGRDDLSLYLGEYNMSWNWRSNIAEGMSEMPGAIFDAMVIMEMIQRSALTGAMAWNEHGDPFGKMSRDFKMRPGGHLLHLCNKYLHGRKLKITVKTETGRFNVANIQAIGASDGDRWSVMVVNTSEEIQQVSLSLPTDQAIAGPKVFEIAGEGLQDLTGPDAGLESIEMKPLSIRFIILDKCASSNGAPQKELKPMTMKLSPQE